MSVCLHLGAMQRGDADAVWGPMTKVIDSLRGWADGSKGEVEFFYLYAGKRSMISNIRDLEAVEQLLFMLS